MCTLFFVTTDATASIARLVLWRTVISSAFLSSCHCVFLPLARAVRLVLVPDGNAQKPGGELDPNVSADLW